ncbi:hypothetical protein EI94DRAFT_1700546 [Lactarius quietus]|nr:hypothetical protein EI94DRAFT_1700546 [Lactarius quietus]
MVKAKSQIRVNLSQKFLPSFGTAPVCKQSTCNTQHQRVAVFWADACRGKVDRFRTHRVRIGIVGAHTFSKYLLLKLGTPTSEFVFEFLCAGDALTVGASTFSEHLLFERFMRSVGIISLKLKLRMEAMSDSYFSALNSISVGPSYLGQE